MPKFSACSVWDADSPKARAAPSELAMAPLVTWSNPKALILKASPNRQNAS